MGELKTKVNTASVSCLDINKLADIDMTILEKLIAESFVAMQKLHNP